MKKFLLVTLLVASLLTSISFAQDPSMCVVIEDTIAFATPEAMKKGDELIKNSANNPKTEFEVLARWLISMKIRGEAIMLKKGTRLVRINISYDGYTVVKAPDGKMWIINEDFLRPTD